MTYRKPAVLAILAGLVMLAGILLAALAAHSAMAATPRQPYGPLSAATLNWRAPPSGAATLAPGAVATLPRGLSDVDVWLVNRQGQSVYRLRQRADAIGRRFGVEQYAFTRAYGRRAYAGYVPENGDVFSFTSRALVRVYWWRG